MASTVNQNIKPITTKRNELGNLEISGCDVVELAKKYGTPLYVMDEITLRQIANEYKNAFSNYKKVNMMFASKALMTSAIAQILHSEGFGFDVVSGGEIYTIKNAGVDMNFATFNGSNKTSEEIEMALNYGIGRISVDNFYEIELLNEIAKKLNKTQKILLRITPGIECHTHEYIQTGNLDSKFGFDLSQIDEVIEIIKNYENLEIKGLHAHIGSQIFETKVYYDEIEILIKETKRINDKFNLNLDEMNIGGGLGITYTKEDCPPSVYEIADVIIKSIKENCEKYNLDEPTLFIEPGRSIVGTAGVSLYTIGSSKIVPNLNKKYIAIDGGMADNIRPAMYDAKYIAEIANKKENEKKEIVTIAGRFCESGDILIKEIELNSPKAGDILCVYNTGAYGYSMASNYNRVLKPAMVLVNNTQSDIIIKRESFDQLIQNDVLIK